ncbi:MAG: hypothetical protein H7A45_10430 [Verrucomicrobiales bacterium]|nr:hypothetical protein [Verrucomicrobiales bacterium]
MRSGWFMMIAMCLHLCIGAWAGSGRVIKVLPHLLDAKGRHALSPSLYDRDAYQAELRANPDLCHGLRFDVQWKARRVDAETLSIKVELVTSETTRDKPLVLQQAVKPSWLGSRWAKLVLDGGEFKQAGGLVAWKVSLWEGETLLDSEQSFLW